eukprot:scaffold11421_cov67-Phaeocystis_antarctica.AAC.6
MWQALTTSSVCFKISDVGIDASGIVDAIVDFWENNPAVKAVQQVQSGPPASPGTVALTISGCVQAASLL